MIIDAECSFNTVTSGAPVAQALTATAVSNNVIDLGGDFDLGVGEPMCVVFDTTVDADFTTGNETYQIDIQTATDAAITSAVVIATRIPTAAMLTTLAPKIVIPIPADNLRYLRINYTLGGTTPTWSVIAHLQPMSMVQNERYYPVGYTII